MMRNNGLLRWTLHKNKHEGVNGVGKNWVHPPDQLTNGHIAYLVKFLGVTEAEHPKGIEVVKDSIRKLKLDEEIRRAEGGKTPKAEVTISVEGVAVQEPKGKKILHQFPLHQISYCADDKEEKKFFSFIAKDGEIHRCFVFTSEKLAEEITLTIGQAFDLAYKRFLDSSGRELELKREIMVLQKRIVELENENMELKEKACLGSMDGNSNSSLSSSTSNALDLICPPVPPRGGSANVANQIIAEFTMAANEIEKRAQVGRKLEGLLIDEDLFDTKSRNGTDAPRILSPPPKGKKADTVNGSGSSGDIFSSDPFFTASDPFGMPDFGSAAKSTSNTNGIHTMTNGNGIHSMTNGNGSAHVNGNNMKNTSSSLNFNGFNGFDAFQQQSQQQKPQAIDNALQILDKRIEEMKNGFSRGILNDDLTLEMLDPLRQSS